MTTREPLSDGGEARQDPLFTWSQAAPPASRSARPGDAAASLTNVGNGPQWRTPFASYDPATSSWKTWQTSLPIEPLSGGSSPTWPDSGSMRNGRCYPRAPWVHHTCGDGCCLWPTPTFSMGRHGWGLTAHGIGQRSSLSMHRRVRGVITSLGRWRPPVLTIEILMGLPERWLSTAVTPSSPRSPS
jgi:hypothetical protein